MNRKRFSLQIMKSENIQIIDNSGNFAAITVIDKKNLYTGLKIINSLNGEILYSKQFDKKNLSSLNVTALEKHSSFLIDLEESVPPEKNQIVDVWYGNDNNLEAKKYGNQINYYWLWDSKTGMEIFLDNTKFSKIVPINNSRYFLAYHPLEENNYLTHRPLLTVQVYDILLNKFQTVFKHISDITTNKSGELIIGFDQDIQKWLLFNVISGEKFTVYQEDLLNPAFTSDGKWILFESVSGLWKYDLKKNTIIKDSKLPSIDIAILNRSQKDLNSHFNIRTKYINIKNPLFLKLWDKKDNTTSYVVYKNDDIREIIRSTPDRIKELKYDKDLRNFAFIRENYNTAPKLQIYRNKSESISDCFAVSKNESEKKVLQEVFNFKNSLGKALKGILYYPVNFNPSKKYPMVVHIYQIQSHSSNRFLLPANDDPIGFNIRLLQQKGYFVLLPDIAHDFRGTGLSALDCVHSALDAVDNNSGIDKTKIGLTGHSHGGYETNFIATHSNRFAAYISGSGHSDIIRAYFSYSYQYDNPFYWQFENQQYEMKKSFAEDKALYIQNNPIIDVDKVNAPILLWTGQLDETVHWGHTMEFYIGLKRNNKNVIALFYPEKEHDVGKETPESFDLNRRVLEWWDYFLKLKKNIPWIDHQMKKDAF